MDNGRGIPAHLRSARERKKRQREIVLAGVGVVLIFLLTWIELRLLGVSSYLFLPCSMSILSSLFLFFFLSYAMLSNCFLNGDDVLSGQGCVPGWWVFLSLYRWCPR